MNTQPIQANLSGFRRSLTKTALGLRAVEAARKPDLPRFVSYDSIRMPDGRILGRKKVIVISGGCSIPTCTMCPFTNENNYGQPRSTDALLEQIVSVLSRSDAEPAYEVLALYNDGSFFAITEIPIEVQQVIARLVANTGVQHLVVESLPQFITKPTVKPFATALGKVPCLNLFTVQGGRLEYLRHYYTTTQLETNERLSSEQLAAWRCSCPSFQRVLE